MGSKDELIEELNSIGTYLRTARGTGFGCSERLPEEIIMDGLRYMDLADSIRALLRTYPSFYSADEFQNQIILQLNKSDFYQRDLKCLALSYAILSYESFLGGQQAEIEAVFKVFSNKDTFGADGELLYFLAEKHQQYDPILKNLGLITPPLLWADSRRINQKPSTFIYRNKHLKNRVCSKCYRVFLLNTRDFKSLASNSIQWREMQSGNICECVEDNEAAA